MTYYSIDDINKNHRTDLPHWNSPDTKAALNNKPWWPLPTGPSSNICYGMGSCHFHLIPDNLFFKQRQKSD